MIVARFRRVMVTLLAVVLLGGCSTPKARVVGLDEHRPDIVERAVLLAFRSPGGMSLASGIAVDAETVFTAAHVLRGLGEQRGQEIGEGTELGARVGDDSAVRLRVVELGAGTMDGEDHAVLMRSPSAMRPGGGPIAAVLTAPMPRAGTAVLVAGYPSGRGASGSLGGEPMVFAGTVVERTGFPEVPGTGVIDLGGVIDGPVGLSGGPVFVETDAGWAVCGIAVAGERLWPWRREVLRASALPGWDEVATRETE